MIEVTFSWFSRWKLFVTKKKFHRETLWPQLVPLFAAAEINSKCKIIEDINNSLFIYTITKN